MRISVLLPSAILACVASSPAPAGPNATSFTELGTLGGSDSSAGGSNRHGQVVGSSRVVTGERHVFLWERGVMNDLGIPGRATDINDAGQVVGVRESGDEPPQAFLWWRGTTTDLGRLDGDDASEAMQINERGQVVGRSWRNGTDGRRAFIWQDGIMIPLGALPGCISTAPLDLNERGQVVGWSTPDPRGDRLKAFLWQDGAMQDLGTLGGLRTSAAAINERGQIVGFSDAAQGGSHAYLWQDGVMIALETLGGSASATAINERGQIVGFSFTASSERRAVLWEHGTITDLGTLPGLKDHFAWDINERGQVVGYGRSTIGSSDFRGFLWHDGVAVNVGPGILTEISDHGDARGNYRTAAGNTLAYLVSSSPSNGDPVRSASVERTDRVGASSSWPHQVRALPTATTQHRGDR